MRLPLSRIAGFLLFVFLLLPPLVWGQSTTSFLQTKSFQFNSRSIPVQIKLDSFVPGTERLIFDSTIVLRDSVDYVAEPKKGLIELVGPTWKRMENDSAAHTIQIFYRPQLILARREFTSKSVVLEKDSTQHTRIVQSVAPSAESASDIFGKGLQKSGSIARGFTVATNRDLTLNSGFRLQLNGKLNEEVDVAAALTDENTPIQPEGTTQTLREVDRVFVELKSKEYAATLGDFSVQRGGAEAGEFAHVNRKIQGAQGVGSFTNLLGSDINVLASAEAGVVRGKFTTNQFQGMEGTQGPYRLIGKNGEQHPIVVAGSERVYINGELQTRGEVNDYVIDYAAGEITFTPKHLVTSASRIAIDFEYTDRQYTRNLLGGSLNVRSTDNSFRLNASVLQEADDENSPIDFNLDQNARAILSESGGDRLRASLHGGRLVGRDSASGLAKGQYTAKDTLINGK
ncbi:MAG: hypothetical protein HY966_04295 [Ignavibacteriales bacterium]|nr:hypothetical protein [Ignavibacteriales bacterium]